MKSFEDFNEPQKYWNYVYTECVKNYVCVLLSKPQWRDYKEVVTEASKLADETVAMLKRKLK